MNKLVLIITVVALMMPAFNSCIFDAEQKPPDDNKKPPVYGDLSERDHVLKNLELAYNQRDDKQYDRLLDVDFIFHFSPIDVQNGDVSFSQWDRAREVGATANIFNRNFSPPDGRAPVSKIDLSLEFPPGEDTWQAVSPSDPEKYPDEMWYEKKVDYLLTVDAGEDTFTSGQPIGALFTVRFTEVEGDSIWRIIIWRDEV